LAGPIPANSLSKKDVVRYDILVREPETPDSELEIFSREPEVVEARGCYSGPRGCI